MAETMLVAFGRFLRLLRERRGLSLDHVEALTAAYPEPVSKVYLSRVENGHSKIAFSRMIALCRAYEYPIDAASERLWLDLGVDRMEDPPDTAGKGARELLREGRNYLQRGFRWHAYACARDAISVAKTTPVSEVFRDHEEQFAVCLMNTGSAALQLGRWKFALVEFRTIDKATAVTTRYQPLLKDRVAAALLAAGRISEAAAVSDEALVMAGGETPNEYLPYLHATRGLIASRSADLSNAEKHYQSAQRLFMIAGSRGEAANMLANLAQVYFNRDRVGAARRALAAARKIALELDLRHLSARLGILQGEIRELGGDRVGAETTWREALRTAETVQDATLIFKLKFFLYRSALRDRRLSIARRYEKSLARLIPWIPENTDELLSFKQLTHSEDHKTETSGLPLHNGASPLRETDLPSIC